MPTRIVRYWASSLELNRSLLRCMSHRVSTDATGSRDPSTLCYLLRTPPPPSDLPFLSHYDESVQSIEWPGRVMSCLE